MKIKKNSLEIGINLMKKLKGIISFEIDIEDSSPLILARELACVEEQLQYAIDDIGTVGEKCNVSWRWLSSDET